MDKRVLHELEPLYDAHTEVLILGSFPSVVSRKQHFYYANPTNRFWSVLSAVFEEEISDRRAFCLSHHIGLWDVISSCTISGSSDSSIKDVIPNDINRLIEGTAVHAVFTTGAKAASLYRTYIKNDLTHIALPSSSAANASMNKEQLIKEYIKIREILEPSKTN